MNNKPQSRLAGGYRKALLYAYDLLSLIFVDILLIGFAPSTEVDYSAVAFLLHLALAAVCLYVTRRIAGVYKQIWRYGSASAFIRLIVSDFFAGALYFALASVLPIDQLSFVRYSSIILLNLLITLSMRLVYQFCYEYGKRADRKNNAFIRLIRAFTGIEFDKAEPDSESSDGHSHTKIRIAIVGAGRVGAMLAEELIKNPRSAYAPCCFIDVDRSKIGREIMGIPVIASGDGAFDNIREYSVQEIVFALPRMESEDIKQLYEHYSKTGCKIKVYDYPLMQSTKGGKRHLREFDIEELLFRKPADIFDKKTSEYYKDKVVLITGGGGSIGGELCRQIARMKPKTLIALDIYENGAYDIQQELKIIYGGKIDTRIEIVSVCDRAGLRKVFAAYRPNIVLHAAAHKHVPLMEHNCCEAVKNNVFGTLNAVELSEEYGVEKFIMISTDKAVNPTNVMGATKRVCEMIVQSHATNGGTAFSATRFGNVLGSAGSVVPLFKKQITNGGPVTITDKRIIRYFMTIPEASQLVLESGAMAKNGELFVLDMGKSIKILDLAENMIRLCGLEPYKDIDIIETGLRPGEKLYEELLIRTEELDKTENSMIFIERDTALTPEELKAVLESLNTALETGDDSMVKQVLRQVVPTYKDPNAINTASGAEEKMKKLSEYTADPDLTIIE